MLALFGTPSGGELLLVMLVVLLLFGAKNLPRMARTLGRTLEEFRRAAREVSDEIIHADEDDLKTPRRLPRATSASAKDDVEEGSANAAAPRQTASVERPEDAS